MPHSNQQEEIIRKRFQSSAEKCAPLAQFQEKSWPLGKRGKQKIIDPLFCTTYFHLLFPIMLITSYKVSIKISTFKDGENEARKIGTTLEVKTGR